MSAAEEASITLRSFSISPIVLPHCHAVRALSTTAAEHQNLTAAKAFITRLTGYTIDDDDLLFRTLDTTGLFAPNANQREALVGDRALALVLADDWYKSSTPLSTVTPATVSWPDSLTGAVVADTRYKSVGGNRALSAFGRRVGLAPHIFIHPGQRGQPVGWKIMATTVEAILGAIWLDSDGDLGTLRAAIEHMDLRRSAT
ncbi:hypothetical protein LTR53_004394 [Teratosphaeriaceae sp. CCFEE 6253]|nr:hypothetical protein LTR53_004394 [Teratosphaeriaceae sp. CCFEE 6253]